MIDEDRTVAEAAAWHAASGDDSMDWTGFTEWLEADPRHARIYDEIALAGALLDEHRMDLRALDRERPASQEIAVEAGTVVALPRRRWLPWGGTALAASLAAALLVPQFIAKPQVYETEARPRRVALEDGSAITLAPHSRLTVSGRSHDDLALEGGAWFDVKHDPNRVLTITAGQLEIRDIGTSFDVQSETGNVRIGVIDGKVTIASEALSQPIHLEKGRSLLFDGKAGSAVVTARSISEIGAWRTGRLFYEDTPLPLVLDDLARYAGVHVKLPDGLRSRRYAGSLIIHDGDAAVRDLAEVMGLAVDGSGGAYSLRERSR